MDWIQKNFKSIIYISFLIPILLVAFVSISHVTAWYGLANPMSWAIYLSVGIEIAALSALAAISAQMGNKVYVPFGIVTLIQFIGNIFFAYQFIDTNSEQFKDWVDLVDPIVSYLGVESGNVVSHKRFLALFSGGMLPIISLSFLHMLVKFEEEDKKKINSDTSQINIEEFSKKVAKKESDDIEDKYTPSEEDLKRLEEELFKLNELKFGKLTEIPVEEQNIELQINEVPKVDEINDDVIESDLETFENDNVISGDSETNTLLVGPNGESIVDETITEIQVEPDFYKEEVADYSLEDDNKTSDNIKRLSYYRSR